MELTLGRQTINLKKVWARGEPSTANLCFEEKKIHAKCILLGQGVGSKNEGLLRKSHLLLD